MLAGETASFENNQRRPHILIGVTSAQTCVVLPERVRAMRDAGFQVSLLSAPGGLLEKTARAEGAEAFAIPMERGFAPLGDLVALFRIWRLLLRLKPDIVEFSTPKAGLLGMLAAHFCEVPVRIYLLRGLKLETSRGLRRRLLLWAEWVSSACADLVVCNSPSLKEEASAMGIAPAWKLVVLGGGSSNGVNLARFAPGKSGVRKEMGIPSNAPVIGFSGRMTADKGLPELVEAFAAILHSRPDAYLLLVGWFDGAEDALGCAVRARIEGHPRILCTGFVEDTAPYYRAMDVMVLPSWREGFPNAVLEAAASGVPAIATHCTGARDAVIPEVTGLLVPAGHPAAICEAVLSLLQNRERRRQMSVAARAWTVECFDGRKVLGRTISLYLNLVRSSVNADSQVERKRAEVATGLPVWP